MHEILANTTTVDENIAAVRNFILQRMEDTAWSLLLLEFKIFAMRHPESKKRLQDLYAGIFYQTDEKKLANLLGEAAKGKNAISRAIAIQALQPVITGLVLEAQLNTALSDRNVLRKVAGRLFDALLEVPTR
jgi:DNA replication protein DnaC